MALSGTISGKYSGWTYKIEWSAKQSITDNQSVITCKHKLVCASGYDLYIGSRSNSCTAGAKKTFTSDAISTSGGKTISLGTTKHTVSHDSDGTKSVKITGTFNIKATLSGVYKGSITASKTVTLDKIPRKATITSAPDFNDEGNPVIKYSNLAGNSVDSLEACIASPDGSTAYVSYRSISKTGTSYTFNLTDAERKTLRAVTTSGSPSREVKFYVRTTIGGTKYYDSVPKTFTVIGGKPIFTADKLDYKDTSSVANITNDLHLIVQNKSTLQASCGAASAQKEAKISKYEFWLSSATNNVKSISAAGSVNFGAINSSSNITLYAKATDNRGNSTTISKTVTCTSYYSPSVKLKAYRVNIVDGIAKTDLDGEYIKCEYTTNIASVAGKNKRTVQITGIKSDPIVVSGDSYVTDFKVSKDQTYKVKAVVIDSFSSSASSDVVTLLGGTRIINVSPDGTGVAFGRKAHPSAYDFSYKVRCYNGDFVTKDNQHGFYVTNKAGNPEPAIYKNDSNLWIGATATNTLPHVTGGVYISAGDKTDGVRVSKLVDGTRTNYLMLDAHNYTNYTDPKGYASPKPVDLYTNSSGTNSTITKTLATNDSLNNYTYLEIFYTSYSGNALESVKVYKPNGKAVDLHTVEAGSATNVTYIRRTKYTISGSGNSFTITPSTDNAGYVKIEKGTVSTTLGSGIIKIVRVIGYK